MKMIGHLQDIKTNKMGRSQEYMGQDNKAKDGGAELTCSSVQKITQIESYNTMQPLPSQKNIKKKITCSHGPTTSLLQLAFISLL